MKKTLLAAVCALGFVGATATAEAKCYNLKDAPRDHFFCVGKNGADSFADRKKAIGICTKVKGSKCGTVSSSSSSCHSNSNKCYDENGKAHRSLKGY